MIHLFVFIGKCSDIVALVTMDGEKVIFIFLKCFFLSDLFFLFISFFFLIGSFTFYDLQTSRLIQYELQVTHKLFGMASMDLHSEDDSEINVDGESLSNKRNDVFVACAWNGNTYVIDYDFNVVKFEFEGRVCAFAAGNFDKQKKFYFLLPISHLFLCGESRHVKC